MKPRQVAQSQEEDNHRQHKQINLQQQQIISSNELDSQKIKQIKLQKGGSLNYAGETVRIQVGNFDRSQQNPNIIGNNIQNQHQIGLVDSQERVMHHSPATQHLQMERPINIVDSRKINPDRMTNSQDRQPRKVGGSPIVSSQPIYYQEVSAKDTSKSGQERRMIQQKRMENRSGTFISIPQTHLHPLHSQHQQQHQHQRPIYPVPVNFNYNYPRTLSPHQQIPIQISVPAPQTIIKHPIQIVQSRPQPIRIQQSIYQQKLIIIYQKFIWFKQRHEYFLKQIAYLNQQLQIVNSQQSWIQLKRRHADLLDRFIQIQQQLNQITRQNQQIIQKINKQQQLLQQDNQPNKKFDQLLTCFKQLQTDYSSLKQKNQNYQELQIKYNKLLENYKKIQYQLIQSKQFIGRLQQTQNVQIEDKIIKKLQQSQKYIIQLQQYINKIQNQNVELQSQIGKKSQIFKQEHQKLVDIIKKKDIERQNIRSNNYQQTLQIQLQQKIQQIQQLKNRMEQMEFQHKSTLQDHIQQLQQQIKISVVSLQKKIKQYQQDIKRKNYQKDMLKNSLENQINSLNQQLDRKNNQSQKTFRQLEEKIMDLEDQLKRKGNQKDANMRALNNRIAQLQDQLTRKNYQIIRPLSDKNIKLEQQLNQKSIQLSKYRQGNQYLRHQVQLRKVNQTIQKKNIEIAQIRKDKQRIMETNQQLQRQYDSLIQELARKRSQVNTLKRQTGEAQGYQNQLRNINELLQKKNQQLFELKAALLDTEQLKSQLNACFQNNQRLNQTIKIRNRQVAQFRQAVFNLQQKVRDLTTQMSTNDQNRLPPRHMVEQIQYLHQTIKKKDQQMSKMRQTLQLKDTNIQQLELQKQKLKTKVISLQRIIQQDKQQANKKYQQYQRDYSKKQKQMEEYTTQLNTNFQQEINSLKGQIKSKQQAIYQLQLQDKQTRSKINILEKWKIDKDTQIQGYLKKIRQLQANVKQNNRILEVYNAQIQQRQKTMKENKIAQISSKQEIKKLQTKIIQIQATLKTKQITLKQLQQQSKQSLQKYKILKQQSQTQKSKYIETIQRQQNQNTLLNQKIISYQNKLINLHQFSHIDYKIRDYQANQIFQQKIIYDLKTENQRLKRQLNDKSNFQKIVQEYKKNKNKNKQKNRQNGQGDIAYIQKRLHDFNHKLEELILDNRENQNQYRYKHTAPRRDQADQQFFTQMQMERKQLLQRHALEIISMKSQFGELQKYCNALQFKLRRQLKNPTQQKTQRITIDQQNVFSQQINYFKDKNKQLEQRVDNLITVNKQLKQKLQSLIKNNSNHPSLSYFKQQVNTLQNTIDQLNIKIKKLTQENRSLKNDSNDKNYKSSQSYDQKILQYQSKIQQCNRKISQLTLQKNMLENQKSSLLFDLNSKQSEIFKIKSQLSSQIFQQKNIWEENNKNLQKKYQNKQLEFVKAINQVRILQAQIERLNQIINKKGFDGNSEINKLKIKISQLQDSNKQYQRSIQLKSQTIQNYQIQINKLKNKIANLQTQLKQFDDVNQKKQNDQSLLNTQISQLNATIKDMDLEIQKLLNQLTRIKSQNNIERNNLLLEISRLTEKNQYLLSQNQKLQQTSKLTPQINYNEIFKQLRYNIELLRSNYIQIDAIFGQLKLRDNNQILLSQRFRSNVERGLTVCSSMFQKYGMI